MNSIKKIVFTTVSMRGGGTERVISTLANYYVKNGYLITILMIADDSVEYKLDNRINICSISEATGGSFIKRIERINSLRSYIKENRDSLFIAMGTVSAMFTLAASYGIKSKIIVSERNDPNRLNHKPISRKKKLLRNLLYLKCSKLVVQTPDVVKVFPKLIQKKSIVILNPLPENLPKANCSNKRNRTVISAGRLTEQKNHRLLIDAFCDFHQTHKDYQLFIYGEGELKEELQDYIQSINMEKTITIFGFCKDLYTKLQTEGIYVSSSNWEGMSNSLIEAVAMGIPTIATDCPVGGSRLIIKNNQNGILIGVKDKNGMTKALCTLADDENVREKISINGEKLREQLSAEKIAREWID